MSVNSVFHSQESFDLVNNEKKETEDHRGLSPDREKTDHLPAEFTKIQTPERYEVLVIIVVVFLPSNKR